MANSQSSINDSYTKAIKSCDTTSNGFIGIVSDLKTYRSILEQIYTTLVKYDDSIITAEVPDVINKLNVNLYENLASYVNANIAVGISISNVQSSIITSITKALTNDLNNGFFANM